MPAGPIIDAHVHLWNPERVEIPWLAGVPSINRPMGLPEYTEATEGIKIAGLVYLQVEVHPVYALIEARDLVAMAATDSRIQGIVPWAPLEFGETARYILEELVALGPLIKGVRRIVQDEPGPEFCLHPRYVEGTRLLGEFGLTADLCCNFRQLGPSVELVRRCPGTEFVLDHIAKPNIREGEMEPWAGQITELASLPNVVCKISGVANEAGRADWNVAEIRPYVDHALDAFGPDRVLFGSDWPVVNLSSDYRGWVATLDEIVSGRSEADKRKLWFENANRFYRLGLTG